MFEDGTDRGVLGGTSVATTIGRPQVCQTVLVAREGDDVSALCDAAYALGTGTTPCKFPALPVLLRRFWS